MVALVSYFNPGYLSLITYVLNGSKFLKGLLSNRFFFMLVEDSPPFPKDGVIFTSGKKFGQI